MKATITKATGMYQPLYQRETGKTGLILGLWLLNVLVLAARGGNFAYISGVPIYTPYTFTTRVDLNAADFFEPYGVAVDGAGNIYVSDIGWCMIRKITPGGTVTTLAGSGSHPGGVDGTGSAARFNGPAGLAVDRAGNVYVADSGGGTIRKITPAGVVTTLAGSYGQNGSADGIGSAARFSYPYGVAVDSAGNVYVADTENHTIRKITPTRVVSTLAGLAGVIGGTDGIGSAARFSRPYGVAVDSAGNVYVADELYSTIRKITPGGLVTTLAGLADHPGNADGIGNSARFSGPMGVAVDGAGNVYVAEMSNKLIRRITPAREVTTLAGNSTLSYPGCADGSGIAALFKYPLSVAVDGAGNVYVVDDTCMALRKGWPSPTSPLAPTPTAATGVTSHGFVANWSGVSGATGYRLDVFANSTLSSYVGGYQNLDVGNSSSRSVSGLSAGQTYYYRVRAYNAVGTSGNSSVIAVTTGTGCDYAILPGSQAFGVDGGNGSVSVTTGAGCGWSVSESLNWLTITSGSGGTGNGTVSFTVDANGGPVGRIGTFTVAGQTFTVTQSGANGNAGRAPMDFDGDGKTDMAVYYPGAGNWYIQQSGDGKTRLQNWGWSATLSATGDYDGDGKPDITVFHPATGNWYIRQSGDGKTRLQKWGWSATVPAPGDYDGDGKTDIAVYYPGNGTLYVQHSSNGQLSWVSFYGNTEIPVPGDYDGDGITDVAMYYPGSGIWSILDSSKGGQERQVNLGGGAGIPVPGDYDGDGQADVAVYYPTLGAWYIRQSASGQIRTQNWGWSAAMPVPGDYDGDGQTDIAVYYPASGTWYIQQSSNHLMKNGGPISWGWSAALPVSPQYQINKWFGLIK